MIVQCSTIANAPVAYACPSLLHSQGSCGALSVRADFKGSFLLNWCCPSSVDSLFCGCIRTTCDRLRLPDERISNYGSSRLTVRSSYRWEFHYYQTKYGPYRIVVCFIHYTSCCIVVLSCIRGAALPLKYYRICLHRAAAFPLSQLFRHIIQEFDVDKSYLEIAFTHVLG